MADIWNFQRENYKTLFVLPERTIQPRRVQHHHQSQLQELSSGDFRTGLMQVYFFFHKRPSVLSPAP